MIAAALAPTEIIVVGEITSAWHTIGPKVEHALRGSSLASNIRVRPAYDGASARLRSAVALVLADHAFYAPQIVPEPSSLSSRTDEIGNNEKSSRRGISVENLTRV